MHNIMVAIEIFLMVQIRRTVSDYPDYITK